MQEFQRSRRHQKAHRHAMRNMIMGFIGVSGIVVLAGVYLREYVTTPGKTDLISMSYKPDVLEGVMYDKPHFSLSYVEKYELPEWVTYELTVDMMNKPKQERTQDFEPDRSVRTGSGHYHDYKSSGFRRGHLVPSGDMAWNKEAMDATFLLSNVAPMKEEFNDGIWLELEHNVRDWSRRYKSIKVVTGPVFKDPITTIGENEILVPRYFYKAAFTVKDGSPLVIGFIMDQDQQTFGPLGDYVVSIDSIENMTGLDLFSNLYGDWDEEIRLEKEVINLTHEWPLNEKWYQQRLEEEKRKRGN